VPEFILSILVAIRVLFRSRADMALEVLALRQQVAVLKRKRPRPTLNSLDRFFWTTLRRFWSRWTDVLVKAAATTIWTSNTGREPDLTSALPIRSAQSIGSGSSLLFQHIRFEMATPALFWLHL